MQIVALDPRSQAAQSLLAQSQAASAASADPAGDAMPSSGAKELFLGVWLAEWLAGCGAVRVVKDADAEPYGEIKGMFVQPHFRGRGLSKALMEQLEAHLRAQGIPLVRLEAGVHQAEALALYERMGYDRREPFGPHAPDPRLVFMEKRLSS
ncbi:GNAT family N-acetyltransferase [Roseateles depolymerans]|uniref:Acetyltransferase n=1 Tax=Roseateles depolymerans TaxID=76731 RepID=A0A0U3MRX2_9BURK|nr:GNAT family N-acetyltransferase [Roseateles depolymerans]ALV05699.1 Acetyltransferase [Roseateles depolymerans]REG13031.1 acetyltransferase (GNAT) family protein [Roseateles depolymerans]